MEVLPSQCKDLFSARTERDGSPQRGRKASRFTDIRSRSTGRSADTARYQQFSARSWRVMNLDGGIDRQVLDRESDWRKLGLMRKQPPPWSKESSSAHRLLRPTLLSAGARGRLLGGPEQKHPLGGWHNEQGAGERGGSPAGPEWRNLSSVLETR